MMRLTIENTGASTAIDVTARTRSGIEQLHGHAFSFGKVQPGAKVTRTKSIQLPSTVTGDTAAVVITISEANGQAPADISQRLQLTRAVCPDGKLTRPQYNAKRAKLQKAVDEGTLKQDEFEKLEAELVRCLE